MPSRTKLAIANVLKDEGYIADVRVTETRRKAELEFALKYYEGKPVIETPERVSAPACASTAARTRCRRSSAASAWRSFRPPRAS
jgi:ribosomal protein S8